MFHYSLVATAALTIRSLCPAKCAHKFVGTAAFYLFINFDQFVFYFKIKFVVKHQQQLQHMHNTDTQ